MIHWISKKACTHVCTGSTHGTVKLVKGSQQINTLKKESSKWRWFKIAVHKRQLWDFNYDIGIYCTAGMFQDLLMVMNNCPQFSPTPPNSHCLQQGWS